jgi:hypothetical protein
MTGSRRAVWFVLDGIDYAEGSLSVIEDSGTFFTT